MIPLPMAQIAEAIRDASLPEIDLIVGIATGGTVPASLIAYRLKKDLIILPVNFRDPQNNPQHPRPTLTASMPKIPEKVRQVLLVDDVSVSGKTMNYARSLLPDLDITTLVLKGSADIVLFPEVDQCVKWPWKLYEQDREVTGIE